ncbi:MAG: MaoC family dehydratase N-terminal domain-containing protein [Pseudomonadales bacterium]|nr:MaoC family dehydratase N-terminal domain-containing protein [Pseudomonadales bacterium]
MSEAWQEWIGRQQQVDDHIRESTLLAMGATLDGIQQDFSRNGIVPALWHWLYFLDKAPQTQLANDGHEKRGNFLPPVPLPRRMWAASKLKFHSPLRVDEQARRESTIKSIETKEGKSGSLVFVTVDHHVHGSKQLAISEEQTIVYRDHSKDNSKVTGRKVEESADFEKTIAPDILLLFRYSSLTFNAHRIHYDRDYATDTEGYPGLIVHGPLMATLLVGALQEQHPDKKLESFEFRAMKPVFDLAPFKVCGRNPDDEGNAKLWIADSDNELCMQATAKLKI